MAKTKAPRKRPRGGATYPCPHCGSRTRVLTTRREDEGVRRRRKCTSRECGVSFQTLEELK